MKKCFNNVQMFKSSDVCNKFSKSVSYETLVGGTTTTGRKIKQTRRLSKGSADKPLSAVGTLTSLLCNSAKVVEKLLYRHPERSEGSIKTGTVIIGRGCEPIISAESLYCHARPRSGISAESERDPRLIATQSPRMTEKALSFLRLRGASGAQGISAPASCRKAHKRRFLFNSWILRFVCTPLRMTIPVLALIFTLATTAESWANDEIPTSGTCNSDGTCLWSLGSDGTLTISAEDGAKDVKMDDYYCYHNPCSQSSLISRPWEASLQQIKSVVIGDNITHIGDDAFQNASNLTSVTGMKDVKTIGEMGVFAFTGLKSITIPEGVTSIGYYAFWGATRLESITIPEGVTSIGWNIFGAAKSLTSITIPDNINTANWSARVFQNLSARTNIVCQGDVERCKQKLAKYIPTDKGGTCTEYCINNKIQPALFDSCKSTNYFWDGSTCIREPDVSKRKCCSSCKDMGGWCNRIRYTPAEAAEVLTDDNNNSVTITFKK